MTTALQKLFPNEPVPKSSNLLLAVRLWFYSAAWIHVIIAAVLIIPIDLSLDEDPKIRAYGRLKWRLITTWFNLLFIVYLPLCIYCDWKEKRRETHLSHIATLKQIRDVLFTSVLLPMTMYADTLFWLLYYTNFSFICTPNILKYLPTWMHHSLHTVSMVVVVLDLMLVPRSRPRSMTPSIGVMTAYFTANSLVVYERYFKGEAVYAVLDILSGPDCVLLMVMCYVTCLFFFSLQWFVVDYIWGPQKEKKTTLKDDDRFSQKSLLFSKRLM